MSNGDRSTVIYAAAWAGHTDVLHELISAGERADFALKTDNVTPLFAAATEVMLKLLELS